MSQKKYAGLTECGRPERYGDLGRQELATASPLPIAHFLLPVLPSRQRRQRQTSGKCGVHDEQRARPEMLSKARS